MKDSIENEFEILRKFHSCLTMQKQSDIYIISGPFGFKTTINNIYIENYFNIEMSFTKNFHQDLPIVKEIDGKIVHTPDNHINDDGTCCLGFPLAIKMKLGLNFRLIDFFQEIVVPYFAQYTYKEKYDKWPYGETAHFAEGIFEYYMETFGLKTYTNVISFLETLANIKSRPKGYMRCNCGCNKLIKNCPNQKLLKKAYVKGHNYRAELRHAKRYLEEQNVNNKN